MTFLFFFVFSAFLALAAWFAYLGHAYLGGTIAILLLCSTTVRKGRE